MSAPVFCLILHFNIAKILHIDTLVIWLLMGFFGAVYWFLPGEFGRELGGIALAEILFYIFCAAVAVVAVVFIFVQYGGSTESALWFINQGANTSKRRAGPRLASSWSWWCLHYNVVGTA